MSALTDLQAVWQSRIDALTDSETKAMAGIALADYIAAKTAHSAAVSQSLSSYSIQGRSASRRDPEQLQATADAALARLNALFTAGYTLADASTVSY